MGLFGQSKQKDPRETVRELQKKLRAEQRGIDRNINHIKREELKVSMGYHTIPVQYLFSN